MTDGIDPRDGEQLALEGADDDFDREPLDLPAFLGKVVSRRGFCRTVEDINEMRAKAALDGLTEVKVVHGYMVVCTRPGAGT